MAAFRYRAVDSNGQLQEGVITAPSIAEANGRLFATALIPISLDTATGDVPDSEKKERSSRFKRVSVNDLILFTKQLATMIRVGVPIPQALETLQGQTDNVKLRSVCRAISVRIQEGKRLCDAIAEHPKVFKPPYDTIIAAGEKSGMLPEAMDRLTYLMEHEAMVRAEVKSAMRYPIMVVGALIVAFVILVGFVIPKFATFFTKASITLPLPTRICLWMSDFFTSYGLYLLVGAVGMAIAFRFVIKIPRARDLRDRFLLKIPLIGPVVIKAAMSRFASIFSILQSSGVLILESLELVNRTIENQAIAADLKRVHKAIEEGQGIADPLRNSAYFPPLLTSMVAVGEETGHLDEMLRITSDHFDTELRHSMKKLTSAIGPILIVTLTIVVGFFALAIYLPMWELTQMATK